MTHSHETPPTPENVNNETVDSSQEYDESFGHINFDSHLDAIERQPANRESLELANIELKRLQIAAENLGISQEALFDKKGPVDGFAMLYDLSEAISANGDRIPTENEAHFMNYMNSVIQKMEARSLISDEKLMRVYGKRSDVETPDQALAKEVKRRASMTPRNQHKGKKMIDEGQVESRGKAEFKVKRNMARQKIFTEARAAIESRINGSDIEQSGTAFMRRLNAGISTPAEEEDALSSLRRMERANLMEASALIGIATDRNPMYELASEKHVASVSQKRFARGVESIEAPTTLDAEPAPEETRRPGVPTPRSEAGRPGKADDKNSDNDNDQQEDSDTADATDRMIHDIDDAALEDAAYDANAEQSDTDDTADSDALLADLERRLNINTGTTGDTFDTLLDDIERRLGIDVTTTEPDDEPESEPVDNSDHADNADDDAEPTEPGNNRDDEGISAEAFNALQNYQDVLVNYAHRKIKRTDTLEDLENYQEAIRRMMAQDPQYSDLLDDTNSINPRTRAALINKYYVDRFSELRKASAFQERDAHETGFSAFVARNQKAIKIGGALFAGFTALTGNIPLAAVVMGATTGMVKGAQHQDKKAKEFFEADTGAAGTASFINPQQSLDEIHAAGPMNAAETAEMAFYALMNEHHERFSDVYESARKKRRNGSLTRAALWGGGTTVMTLLGADFLNYQAHGAGGFMDHLNHLDNANGLTPWKATMDRPWWATAYGISLAGGAAWALGKAVQNKKKKSHGRNNSAQSRGSSSRPMASV